VAFDWLESLETRVREALERLDELKVENRSLRAEIKVLEARVAEPGLPFGDRGADQGTGAPTLEELEVLQGRIEELEAALTKAEADRDEARSAADRYSEEREEIRKRVEALTARLQGLAAG
jgi:FtsZ-binding cell division protein ZapB